MKIANQNKKQITLISSIALMTVTLFSFQNCARTSFENPSTDLAEDVELSSGINLLSSAGGRLVIPESTSQTGTFINGYYTELITPDKKNNSIGFPPSMGATANPNSSVIYLNEKLSEYRKNAYLFDYIPRSFPNWVLFARNLGSVPHSRLIKGKGALLSFHYTRVYSYNLKADSVNGAVYPVMYAFLGGTSVQDVSVTKDGRPYPLGGLLNVAALATQILPVDHNPNTKTNHHYGASDCGHGPSVDASWFEHDNWPGYSMGLGIWTPPGGSDTVVTRDAKTQVVRLVSPVGTSRAINFPDAPEQTYLGTCGYFFIDTRAGAGTYVVHVKDSAGASAQSAPIVVSP